MRTVRTAGIATSMFFKRPEPGRTGGMDHASAASRLSWVDIARGIGILLVVYAHAMRGVMLGLDQAPAWAVMQDRLIYAFHMPLFFLLAGLFVERAVARGRAGFLRSKLITLAWPYLLWSVIEWSAVTLVGGRANSPSSLSDLASIGWQPFHHFWFLYALFLMHLAAAVLLPRLAVLASFCLVPFLFAGLGFIPLAQALDMLPFYVLGVAVARTDVLRRGWSAPLQLAAAALALAGLFALDGLREVAAGTGVERLRTILAAILGIVMTLLVARTLALASAMRRLGDWLAALGRMSMTIFVAHTLFSAGIRMVVLAAAPGAPFWLLAVLVTVAGVVGPVILHQLIVRHGRLEWLGLGRTPVEQVAVARAAA